MRILQTNGFKTTVKKLHANQKDCLDDTILVILSDPLIGTEKIGDLSNVRIYKFRMIEQLTLLSLYPQSRRFIYNTFSSWLSREFLSRPQNSA